MIIHIPEELWSASIMPSGIFERWLVPEATLVQRGDPIAQILIEDAAHTLVAGASGYLLHAARENDVIAPGAVVGRVSAGLA